MLEDLTPLNVLEVEKYLFQHQRILFQDLDSRLQMDIEEALGEVVLSAFVNPESLEKIKNRVLAFNMTKMKNHIQGTYMVDAQLDFAIQSIEPFRIEFWVDYYGIDNQQVEALPLKLKRELMDKYIHGWRDMVSNPANTESLKTLFAGILREEFLGQKAPRTPDVMKERCRNALWKTGILEDLEVNWEPLFNRLDIKAQLVNSPNHIQLSAVIQ